MRARRWQHGRHAANILAGIADPRLRVLQGGKLPAGWSGKQTRLRSAGGCGDPWPDGVSWTPDVSGLSPDALCRIGWLYGAEFP